MASISTPHQPLASTSGYGAGLLVIPATTTGPLRLRFRTLEARDGADPRDPGRGWEPEVQLLPVPGHAGDYQIDLDGLHLKDGTYEYEFVADGATDHVIPDPFSEEIVKFGGYRGVFHIAGGRRVKPPFSWEGELPEGVRLAENHALVIYEMAVHWMSMVEPGQQVAIGTFERVVFERLEALTRLGINAIELLPVQDSPNTFAWGYGTRYFLAPDWDMGTPLELKFFIRCCHQRGIRVLLDVVMNHALDCPLEKLAEDRYFLPKGSQEEGTDRQDWGGRLFRYATPVDGHFWAREFQYRMARFWIHEYHVDGFRIDEFKGINNWDFVQEFRAHAWAEHSARFPNRPFIVIAEDSGQTAGLAKEGCHRGGKVVDAIWNFAFRGEVRRLLRNRIDTRWGEPARRERIEALISGRRAWDDWNRRFGEGFSDLTQTINYITSHDTKRQDEQRLMNLFMSDLLQERGLVDFSGLPEEQAARRETRLIRQMVDHLDQQPVEIREVHAQALERVGSAFALLLTAVGIPMFVNGEEFADVHDLEHTDDWLKQMDAINWARREYPGHRELEQRVRDLIALRTRHPALQRNEVAFFYFHPTIDENGGTRVFAWCRTGGMPLGSPDQVVVVANTGPEPFEGFDFPWPWGDVARLKEVGAPMRAGSPVASRPGVLTVSIAPFQVRVFTT